MKKSGLLKSLVVVLLSGVLVANLATFVFADDNLSWDDLSSGNNTSAGNTTNNTSTLDTNDTNLSTTNNTSTLDTNTNTNYSTSGNLSTNLSTNSSTNTNVNEDKNELAYTGFEDNTILPVMIVLGILVTAYSVKKIKEYNF